jgi:hypothetical protein
MKHITLIIIAMLLSVGAFAQHKYDTDFTHTKMMKVSGKTFDKAGHIVFDGDEHLTMTYTTPEGDYFIIDGDMVKINMDGKKAELDAEKVPMVKLQRATLLNCLSGNWQKAALDNNAEATVKESKGLRNIVLTVKGKVPKGGYSSMELTYRLSDHMLTRMVLEEAIGIVNTYEIK